MNCSLKLKKNFVHSTSGRIVSDSKSHKLYTLEEHTLSKIETKELQPVKQFNIDQKIINLAINGDDLALLSEKNEILYFSGESLLWQKQIPDPNSSTWASQFLFYVIILGFLPALFGGMWLTRVYGLFLSIATGFLISVGFLLLFLLFTKLIHREADSVYLADVSGNHKNDVVLLLGNKKMYFLDGEDGTLIQNINLGNEFQDVKVIKIVDANGKQQLWIRTKKNSAYHALSIGLAGVITNVEEVALVDVLDWNHNGEYELVSATKNMVSILTDEGSNIFKIESQYDLVSVVSGDIDGDSQHELLLLALKDEKYHLLLLKDNKLRPFKIPDSPLHLQLVGIKAISQEKKGEIVLRAFTEEGTKIIGFSFVPETTPSQGPHRK